MAKQYEQKYTIGNARMQQEYPTQKELYNRISDAYEWQDKVKKEYDEIIDDAKDRILIEQIIHSAILEVLELKSSDITYQCFDLTSDKRHKLVYELAKQLKEARAKNADLRLVMRELYESLQGVSDLIIKFWQSNKITNPHVNS